MIFFKPKDSWSLLINVKKTLINNARDKESEENYDKVVGNIKEGKYYSLNGFSFVVFTKRNLDFVTVVDWVLHA